MDRIQLIAAAVMELILIFRDIPVSLVLRFKACVLKLKEAFSF